MKPLLSNVSVNETSFLGRIFISTQRIPLNQIESPDPAFFSRSLQLTEFSLSVIGYLLPTITYIGYPKKVACSDFESLQDVQLLFI